MKPASNRSYSGLTRVLAELALIIVGVMIALAASDWQEAQAARATERTLLEDMRDALSLDVVQVERGLDRYNDLEKRLEVLAGILRSREPYADSLDSYFGAVYGTLPISLNTAVYESLKAQGLGLIENQELRSQIVRVYEVSYDGIEFVLASERAAILDLYRPYFLTHFADLRFNLNATPLDYAEVAGDPEFRNLVDYRIELIRGNHLPRFEVGLTAIRDLLAEITEELEM